MPLYFCIRFAFYLSLVNVSVRSERERERENNCLHIILVQNNLYARILSLAILVPPVLALAMALVMPIRFWSGEICYKFLVFNYLLRKRRAFLICTNALESLNVLLVPRDIGHCPSERENSGELIYYVMNVAR